MSEFSPLDLRRAFGRFPTGVTVVTTCTGEGRQVGFTANSFTSVSMSPPLVLVCLDRRASVHPAFLGAAGFVVNILAHDQAETAMRFASRGIDRFEGIVWKPSKTGLPILDGHAAFFECASDQAVPAGDHTVLMGRIVDMGDTDALPLVFRGGAFARITQPEHAGAAR